MVQFILSRFDLENKSEQAIRNLVGKISGIIGIFFNLFYLELNLELV